MPYTLEDFYREWVEEQRKEILEKMTTEDLERLLQQRRAAEAASKAKPSGQPGRGSAKRRRM